MEEKPYNSMWWMDWVYIALIILITLAGWYLPQWLN
jgi:hypothetical protein